jgi:IS30 family transposase
MKINEKLEIGVSNASIADEYGIAKQTASGIKRNKEKSKQRAMNFDVSSNGEMLEKKSLKKPHDEKLEEAVYKWYVQQ